MPLAAPVVGRLLRMVLAMVPLRPHQVRFNETKAKLNKDAQAAMTAAIRLRAMSLLGLLGEGQFLFLVADLFVIRLEILSLASSSLM